MKFLFLTARLFAGDALKTRDALPTQRSLSREECDTDGGQAARRSERKVRYGLCQGLLQLDAAEAERQLPPSPFAAGDVSPEVYPRIQRTEDTGIVERGIISTGSYFDGMKLGQTSISGSSSTNIPRCRLKSTRASLAESGEPKAVRRKSVEVISAPEFGTGRGDFLSSSGLETRSKSLKENPFPISSMCLKVLGQMGDRLKSDIITLQTMDAQLAEEKKNRLLEEERQRQAAEEKKRREKEEEEKRLRQEEEERKEKEKIKQQQEEEEKKQKEEQEKLLAAQKDLAEISTPASVTPEGMPDSKTAAIKFTNRYNQLMNEVNQDPLVQQGVYSLEDFQLLKLWGDIKHSELMYNLKHTKNKDIKNVYNYIRKNIGAEVNKISFTGKSVKLAFNNLNVLLTSLSSVNPPNDSDLMNLYSSEIQILSSEFSNISFWTFIFLFRLIDYLVQTSLQHTQHSAPWHFSWFLYILSQQWGVTILALLRGAIHEQSILTIPYLPKFSKAKYTVSSYLLLCGGLNDESEVLFYKRSSECLRFYLSTLVCLKSWSEILRFASPLVRPCTIKKAHAYIWLALWEVVGQPLQKQELETGLRGFADLMTHFQTNVLPQLQTLASNTSGDDPGKPNLSQPVTVLIQFVRDASSGPLPPPDGHVLPPSESNISADI